MDDLDMVEEPDSDSWLRVSEVAAMLGWGDQRVRGWAKRPEEPRIVAREIAPPPARDRWRFDPSSVRRLAAARPDLLGPSATLRVSAESSSGEERLQPADDTQLRADLERVTAERDHLRGLVTDLRATALQLKGSVEQAAADSAVQAADTAKHAAAAAERTRQLTDTLGIWIVGDASLP